MRSPGSLVAWLFMAPALLVLGLFTFYPILCGVLLAFFDFSMLRHTPEGLLAPPRFVGLENFQRLLHDRYFWTALANSILYLLVVPVLQILSILIAVAVNQPLRGVRFFRTALYVPVVTSVVVVGIAWKWVLRSDGLANRLLEALGIGRLAQLLGVSDFLPVPWLTDPDWALFSVMLVTLWQGLGYYMILYLAGLQTIPSELEEAARLDGAGFWAVFTRITLPMLRPTLVLCTILSCISALKVFGEIYVMTGGGPQNGTLTMVFYIYNRAFEGFEMGYSAALALVLAMVVGLISYVNVRWFQEGGMQGYD